MIPYLGYGKCNSGITKAERFGHDSASCTVLRLPTHPYGTAAGSVARQPNGICNILDLHRTKWVLLDGVGDRASCLKL